MPSADQALPLRHAIALGLLQGPAELLPISSSAHTTLVPWLAGWPYARLAGEQRKSFEVALHAGAGAALAIHMRGQLLRDAARVDPRRAGVIAAALAPPALAGYALGPAIERRLGGPRSIAAGLAAGAVAMAVADRRVARTNDSATADDNGACSAGGPSGRAQEDATARDGLALGLAQTAALIPGVSRNGATLSAARARGFARADSQALSWHAGLPIILGASMLQGARMRRRGVPREQRAALAVGGICAFASTLAGARLLTRPLHEGGPLWPYSLYRCALAAIVVRRHRRERGGRAQ
ncbi:MAG TPA: undecaprenyl-diphosphate phosphatase [Solirubrobacteraceae bacterium]|jgi:undecaprenyl-diphosphatase|nr:undecaprenyl-diphosphate phosphatase [Solirubrobacteraceae bacterium]